MSLPDPPDDKMTLIHDRWIRRLAASLPPGVPESVRLEGWPATSGSYEDGVAKHEPKEGLATLQCGGCRYYALLQGKLGRDWGACTNPRSYLDGKVTFEHWTCKEFTR